MTGPQDDLLEFYFVRNTTKDGHRFAVYLDLSEAVAAACDLMKIAALIPVFILSCAAVYADPPASRAVIPGDNYTPKAYGPGIHSDSTGQAFTWQPDHSQPLTPIFQDQAKPDAYGPGIGADPFGRPVEREYEIYNQ